MLGPVTEHYASPLLALKQHCNSYVCCQLLVSSVRLQSIVVFGTFERILLIKNPLIKTMVSFMNA